MAKVPQIIPISDLRQKATGIVKGLAASPEPVFITQRGRATAVMVGMNAYRQAQQEFEILRLLARGGKEIETGKGIELKDILSEADELLQGMKA